MTDITDPSPTTPSQDISTGPLEVLGTLYDTPLTDPEGMPIGQPAALPGWHVNSPWPVTGWQAWHVTPKHPRRVFGGGVTVHYTFADEPEFLAALKTADLTEPPPPPDPKLVGIEFAGVRCSATREDQNGLVAVIAAYQLAPTRFAPTLFEFSNRSQLTLTKDNLMPFVAVWMPFRQSFFKPT
jgi:hypothetical protein